MAVKKKEKKGTQKVQRWDYTERVHQQDAFINEIEQNVACGNLAVLAEEYRGRRDRKKLESKLIQIFICDDPVATVYLPGLGTYRAKIGNVSVAMDKDKEPCPMVEVWVYRTDGTVLKDEGQEPEVLYYSAWGWTLLDAIDSIGDKMFDALEAVSNKDYSALPEEMRG